jgi:ABC-2 type transport system ATP-binding protein
VTSVLDVIGVSKTYGAHKAVDNLSFSAGAGKIVGFLGPNGAGKSSTLKMAVGIARPDVGEIQLFGQPLSRATLARVGFLPEERGLYRRMTAAATISYFARLKGVPAGTARSRARALLEEYGLGAWADKPVRQLSKGMAQKVQILAAIAHDPDFVILDEPFSGLDPVNQADLEGLVQSLTGRGATVLFSTHVMGHAERLCDQIVVISKGRKLLDATTGEALAAMSRDAIVGVSGDFALGAVLANAGFQAREANAAGEWLVALADAKDSGRLLATCIAAGAPIERFEPVRPSLHDLFVRLVNEAENTADLAAIAASAQPTGNAA